MAINQFFENKGPFPLSKISELIKATNDLSSDHNLIHDIKDLVSAGNKDIRKVFRKTKYHYLMKNESKYLLVLSMLLLGH